MCALSRLALMISAQQVHKPSSRQSRDRCFSRGAWRYDEEKRAALEKWAEVLADIVEVKPAPTTAPRRAHGQHNVYEFNPRPSLRA